MVESQGFRRHGLYYPYFHIRDERWLKTAALYWRKIIRVIPEDYPTANDTDTVRALIDELEFVDRQPPGLSVQAVAPRFVELLDDPDPRLVRRFRLLDTDHLSLSSPAFPQPLLIQAGRRYPP